MANLLLDVAEVKQAIEKFKTMIEESQGMLENEAISIDNLSGSESYQGKYADCIKAYLKQGGEAGIKVLYDDMDQAKKLLDQALRAYQNFESSEHGKIGAIVLDMMKSAITFQEQSFNGLVPTISTIQGRAGKYISPTSINADTVNSSFSLSRDTLDKVKSDLVEADQAASRAIQEAIDLFNEAKNLFGQIMDCVYGGGAPTVESFGSLANQEWYQKAMKKVDTKHLDKMIADKLEKSHEKFGTAAQAGHIWDPVIGDYIIAEAKVGELEAYAKGSATGGEAGFKAALIDMYGDYKSKFLDLHAQFRRYYAKGSAKWGMSEDYFGFGAEGEVGVFKADASGTLHIGDFKLAEAKASAEMLTAKGEATAHVDKDGYGRIALTGEATLAKAEASIKIGGIKYPEYNKEKDTWSSKDLFSVSARVNANVGADAGFVYEKKKVASLNKYVDLATEEVSVDLSAEIGGGISVKAPCLKIKYDQLAIDLWHSLTN